MKRVAILGTRGVPANYGGFETLVENLIENRGTSVAKYTVFCSSRDLDKKNTSYKGAELKYIPLRANGMQSVIYDAVSFFRARNGYDTILMLGISGCIFLPLLRLFRRKKIIVNIDGLEHRRKKWGRFARWFLRISEASAVRFADTIVADNKAICDYVYSTYGKKAEMIAYGGNHVLRTVTEPYEQAILENYSLSSGEYAVALCRIEPENNCHIILDAFSGSGNRLLFIGNWNNNKYGKKLKKEYGRFPNIIMLDPIYDLDTLYVLRKNACCYIHGHSAGGTNPSLVEAMFFGCRIFAFDVIYNRYTTGNNADYFSDKEELQRLISGIKNDNKDPGAMYETACREYTWDIIAKQYENLY